MCFLVNNFWVCLKCKREDRLSGPSRSVSFTLTHSCSFSVCLSVWHIKSQIYKCKVHLLAPFPFGLSKFTHVAAFGFIYFMILGRRSFNLSPFLSLSLSLSFFLFFFLLFFWVFFLCFLFFAILAASLLVMIRCMAYDNSFSLSAACHASQMCVQLIRGRSCTYEA